MSERYEYAVERRIVAKHEVTRLQTRALYGDDDDVPSAEEWGVALVELRESAMEVAMAELESAMAQEQAVA